MFFLQQVANCLFIKDNKAFLLNKFRRGWWVAPGGKVEQYETIAEACSREFLEETGLTLIEPKLSSLFTVVIKKDDRVVDQWMFYNFFANKATGVELEENVEGKLRWQEISTLTKLPMAEGDQVILDHALNGDGLMIGVVTYTEDYQLLDIRYAYH